MRIALHTSDKSGDQTIAHDLNFQSERYESKHTVVSMDVSALLRTRICVNNLRISRSLKTRNHLYLPF